MKRKLWLIVGALALVSTVGILSPRLKYSIPSAGPSFVEQARPDQATPEATVTSMFQMVDQGGESGDAHVVVPDRLNTMHLIAGKDLTPDEQKLMGLFWDNQRSAAIYGYLRAGLTNSATITANHTSGDTATITAAAKMFVESNTEWVDTTYTVDLKKRGPNWYVDELKSSKWPGGVYLAYKQRRGF